MKESNISNESIMKKVTVPALTKEVTSELILPDYLPDVSRLLGTEASLGAQNSYVSGDVIEYDGKLDITVVYATSDGRIKSVPLSSEFDGTLPLPELSGDIAAEINVSVESVNCRLQNPRRLSVRTKLSIGADVYVPESVAPRITGGESERGAGDIMTKKTPVGTVFFIYAADENVPISEDLELDAQDPAIAEIISVSLCPYIYDARATDGSLSYRGDVLAQVLYLASSGDEGGAKYFSVLRKIPISGEVMAPVSEGAFAAGYATVSSVEYRPQANALGENRVIEVDFTYTAHLCAASNATSDAVSDMYSTECRTDTKTKSAKCRRVMRASAFNFTSDGSMPLDEKGYSEVVSSRAVASVDEVTVSGSKAVFSGKADVYTVLTDGNSFVGKTVNVPFRAETEIGKCAGELECSVHPSVIGTSARVDGGEIKCDVEVGISYVAQDVTDASVVDECVLMTDSPIKRAGTSSIVICYPGESETLWDIAKRYGSTEKALRDANGITSDSVSGKVIIVPSK